MARIQQRPDGSQIRKPPIASSGLHARKRSAQRIEEKRASDPGQVNYKEIETIPLGRIRKPLDRRLKQPVNGLAKGGVKHNRDGMRREPLQDVEEQRHASESYEEVSKRG